MLYSEDMTGHAVIGEAAVNLAVREEEISVDALLEELNIVLKAEKTSSRSRRIIDAISWLRDFRTVGARGSDNKEWMLPNVMLTATVPAARPPFACMLMMKMK